MGQVIKVIDVSAIDIANFSLVSDKRDLYWFGNVSDTVFRMDKTGRILRETSTVGNFAFISGLYRMPRHYIATDNTENKMYITTLDFVKIREFSVTDCFGITTDGRHIYYCDATNNLIHKIDFDGNELFSVAGIDATLPRGIEFDGKNFWFTAIDGNLYKFDGNFNLLQTIDLSSFDIFPQSLTFDGRYLWICMRNNSIIVQYAI